MATVNLTTANPGQYYYVQLGQSLPCLTPCKVSAPPGPTPMLVRGPNIPPFLRRLDLPAGPSQVRIQHFTPGRAITGALLGGLGVTLALVGGGALAFKINDSGVAMLTAGSILGLSAIIVGATIKREQAQLEPLQTPALALQTSFGLSAREQRVGVEAK